MPYRIVFSPEALADLQKLAQNEPKSYAKAKRFIDELKEHPKTGLGHPEPLKGKPENRWSREITKNTGSFIAFLKRKFMLMCFPLMAIMMTSDNCKKNRLLPFVQLVSQITVNITR